MPIRRWAIEGLGSVHGSGRGRPKSFAPAEPARQWGCSGGISVTKMVPPTQRIVPWGCHRSIYVLFVASALTATWVWSAARRGLSALPGCQALVDRRGDHGRLRVSPGASVSFVGASSTEKLQWLRSSRHRNGGSDLQSWEGEGAAFCVLTPDNHLPENCESPPQYLSLVGKRQCFQGWNRRRLDRNESWAMARSVIFFVPSPFFCAQPSPGALITGCFEARDQPTTTAYSSPFGQGLAGSGGSCVPRPEAPGKGTTVPVRFCRDRHGRSRPAASISATSRSMSSVPASSSKSWCGSLRRKRSILCTMSAKSAS